jgi:hypothetical protein
MVSPLVPFLKHLVFLLLLCLVTTALSSCTGKVRREGEAVERYLSMRSVLTSALELTSQVERALRDGFPSAREKIAAMAVEGRKVVTSLRASLREYMDFLERSSIMPPPSEILRRQAWLLERCADELEAYWGISSNLARDFPFRENPAYLAPALEQLSQAWESLHKNLGELREGEVELRNALGEG